ncbi:NADH-ubiquinone oxidoreductase 17.2 kD subunit [Acetobacter pasteurianus NBRC 3188]|uniref:NADH-ubiquinone oxidoreductase 17.2 kD subunit n=2 Tax=Acetobacter pasteurianus TaxID=438 RepID=A0A401WQ75_ACEPA|nr:NADH-ubiquinone oxidoreductase 17.2 kD subunit [Acetobacter pasteurianus NBRC 3188]
MARSPIIHNMANFGTWLHTRRKGRLVGKDADGRCYYESTGPARQGGGVERPERWVIYLKGEDPSAVPPEWWGWLHHTLDAPIPAEERKPWQLPHKPNMTGTAQAYRPAGSLYSTGKHPPATGDYEAWTPDA